MHERSVKWNSIMLASVVCERGVWDEPLETHSNFGLSNDWKYMIDNNTVCSTHRQRVLKWGLVSRL